VCEWFGGKISEGRGNGRTIEGRGSRDGKMGVKGQGKDKIGGSYIKIGT